MEAPAFTYTPEPGFFGTDSFTYIVTDQQGGTDEATVTVGINDPPVAFDDAVTVPQKHLTGDVYVLDELVDNDADADGDVLIPYVPSGATLPTHGSLGATASGVITYNPDTGFVGTDTFTYQAFDLHSFSELATVTITVTPRNEPPVAVDDAFTILPGTRLDYEYGDLSANDTDPDNDVLLAFPVSDPTHGILEAVLSGPVLAYRYTPNQGFTGTDSFTYSVEDGFGGQDTGQVDDHRRRSHRNDDDRSDSHDRYADHRPRPVADLATKHHVDQSERLVIVDAARRTEPDFLDCTPAEPA